MATLRELSECTGYSVATISRILNGDVKLSVSDETRRKVLEEAARLNYSATRSRRGRTPKQSLCIGIAEQLMPAQQLEEPFYLYLSSYVRQECLDKKYTYVPLDRREDGFYTNNAERLSGIIAVGRFPLNDVKSLGALSPNLVFLDSSPLESLYDSVVLGYELGISLALEHLFNFHHKRIAFVGPSYNINERHHLELEIRRQTFIRLMKSHDLFDSRLLLETPMLKNESHKTVAMFLKSDVPCPTAFLCVNEESAIGTLAALKEAGLSVPKDVSVVSFDDTPQSTLIEPLLTSVSTHVEEMSKTALRLLSERVSYGTEQPIRTIPLKIVVPPSLVVRDSTGEARAD